MPSAEERKVMHLANIGNYMYDLVKVMTAVNQNLVELGKIMQKVVGEEEVKFAVGDRLYKIPDFTEEDLERNKVARLPNEFDEHFKKEGE